MVNCTKRLENCTKPIRIRIKLLKICTKPAQNGTKPPRNRIKLYQEQFGTKINNGKLLVLRSLARKPKLSPFICLKSTQKSKG
jgi:hypothetical protein